jgi:cytochrome c oxidase cbb3-type subunit III
MCMDEKPKRMTMSHEEHKSSLLMPIKMECQRSCEKCKKKDAKRKRLTEKKSLVILGLLFFVLVPVFAQEVTPTKTFWDDPFNSPMLPLYVVTTLVFTTIVLVMVVALYMLKLLNILVRQARQERGERLGMPYVAEPTWWDKLTQQLTASVPVAQEKDIDLGHNFDGIRELDNHLPPWWKWLFVATIIWGVIYISVYHLSNSLPLSIGEYENELTSAEEQLRILRASQPAAVIDENALVYSADEGILSKGKIIFNGNCIACHRADGGGNAIGPNLTDRFWLHGGSIKNVFSTIRTGVVEKGMPAWGKAMSPQDVRDVAFYVMSLQETNPKERKAPQGELYEPVLDIKMADSLISKN